MVLDHEICNVAGCTVHTGFPKPPVPYDVRNRQIIADWKTGDWLVEELASFWELQPRTIENILRREADPVSKP